MSASAIMIRLAQAERLLSQGRCLEAEIVLRNLRERMARDAKAVRS